jgi:hypothetical protein
MQWLMDDCDATTTFRRSRRAQELDQRGRPRPGVRQWGGWSPRVELSLGCSTGSLIHRGGGIDRRSSQCCGGSACNLIISAACGTGRRKGVGGGASGVFIGGGFLAKEARVAENRTVPSAGVQEEESGAGGGG